MPSLEDVLKAIFTSGSPMVVPSILLVLQLAVYAYVKRLEAYVVLLRAIETSAFGGATATAAALALPSSRIHGVFSSSAVYVVLVMFLLWGGITVGATLLAGPTRNGRRVMWRHVVGVLLLGFLAFQEFATGLDWARPGP